MRHHIRDGAYYEFNRSDSKYEVGREIPERMAQVLPTLATFSTDVAASASNANKRAVLRLRLVRRRRGRKGQRMRVRGEKTAHSSSHINS